MWCWATIGNGQVTEDGSKVVGGFSFSFGLRTRRGSMHLVHGGRDWLASCRMIVLLGQFSGSNNVVGASGMIIWSGSRYGSKLWFLSGMALRRQVLSRSSMRGTCFGDVQPWSLFVSHVVSKEIERLKTPEVV